jgi:hypothetical protein
MKMTVFWDVVPYSLVETDRRFRGTCCLHHHGYESSVNFYHTTWRNIPEDSYLHMKVVVYCLMYFWVFLIVSYKVIFIV